MAGSQEQMAAYTAMLSTYKPAQDKPVTELAIFKLNEEQSDATIKYFEEQIIANTKGGKGVRRQAYGFSTSDPKTFVWMLDWDKIQDHWEFWQTPHFPPVMACIEKLFVPGRPLVRHYDFKPAGMLEDKIQRVFVWDEPDEVRKELGNKAAATIVEKGKARSSKDAYAVDMNETIWRSVILGYGSVEEAAADQFETPEGCEDHVVRLKFV